MDIVGVGGGHVASLCLRQLFVARITNPDGLRRLRRQKVPSRRTGPANDGATFATMVSSVENVELGLGAHHADDGLRVRHPDGRVFVGGLLAALFQQIFDALVDVSHPLLLLCSRGSVDGEGLAPCANQPAVPELTIIIK